MVRNFFYFLPGDESGYKEDPLFFNQYIGDKGDEGTGDNHAEQEQRMGQIQKKTGSQAQTKEYFVEKPGRDGMYGIRPLVIMSVKEYNHVSEDSEIE